MDGSFSNILRNDEWTVVRPIQEEHKSAPIAFQFTAAFSQKVISWKILSVGLTISHGSLKNSFYELAHETELDYSWQYHQLTAHDRA